MAFKALHSRAGCGPYLQTLGGRPARDKHSSLLQIFVNYGCKKFYNIRPRCQCFTKIFLLHSASWKMQKSPSWLNHNNAKFIQSKVVECIFQLKWICRMTFVKLLRPNLSARVSLKILLFGYMKLDLPTSASYLPPQGVNTHSHAA
jgi:hypothetical protein